MSSRVCISLKAPHALIAAANVITFAHIILLLEAMRTLS